MVIRIPRFLVPDPKWPHYSKDNIQIMKTTTREVQLGGSFPLLDRLHQKPRWFSGTIFPQPRHIFQERPFESSPKSRSVAGQILLPISCHFPKKHLKAIIPHHMLKILWLIIHSTHIFFFHHLGFQNIKPDSERSQTEFRTNFNSN